jgi:hypothetical protein
MHDEFHTATEPDFDPPHRNPAARWLRWIIARNPLYPLSAALLLFGINRLSTDPTFLPAEEANLFFNFSALEFYEIMLVGVALLLAHRSIHYDATLLTIIENGLVFVPLVLITQAVLIGRDMAALLCGAAAVLAVVRFALLGRTWVLLPPRLLALGVAVLFFNLIVPFIYRSRMELDATDWLVPGRFCWLLLLPAFVGFANILEQPLRWSDEPHRQTWLPFLMLGLWVSATAIHLRCIDYISGLPFHPVLLAPVLWAAAWTGYLRFNDFTPAPAPRVRAVLLLTAAVVPLLDVQLSYTYLALCCANVMLCAMILACTQGRAAFHVLILSFALALAGVAKTFVYSSVQVLSYFEWLLVAGIAYAVIRALLSHRPAAGFTAALAIALLRGFLLDQPFFHLAVQYGAAFLLIHSLSWERPEGTGATQLRIIAALLWICDSALWTWFDPGAIRFVAAVTMLVLAACAVARWLTGEWAPRLVPIAAGVCLLVALAHHAFDIAKASPTGLLAIIGSFLLFGLGTVAALTRSAWNPPVSRNYE